MRKEVNRQKTASLKHENEFYSAGCRIIVGIDEAGRGPLAGPVAAAAVALPLHRKDLSKLLRGTRDSKEMTAAQRHVAMKTIKQVALCWGIGHSSAKEIDDRGIVAATKSAMQRALLAALDKGDLEPDCLFLDYVLWPEQRGIYQVSIVGGDKRSLSIASASVLAKVWRDTFMIGLHEKYPLYGFAQNKGYGTEAHLSALNNHGPCEYHRQSFKPVSDALVPEDK